MALWPFAPAMLRMDRISRRWSRRGNFHCSVLVLESYLILHRLKPVLLKTVGVKVGPVALASAILRMGSNLRRWSRRAHFHCSVGGLGVLRYLAQAEACATKD